MSVDDNSRDALIERLRVAMLGTTDGDFIELESDVPAGEMFRLAAEWADAVIVPLVEERNRLRAERLPYDFVVSNDGAVHTASRRAIEWQRDAAIKRAEAAEAERDRLREQHVCTCGPWHPDMDGPDETCPQHGRTVADWIERAEAAELRADMAEGDLELASRDRDTWHERWRQLMRDHEAACKERDAAEVAHLALTDAVRGLADEWDRSYPSLIVGRSVRAILTEHGATNEREEQS